MNKFKDDQIPILLNKVDKYCMNFEYKAAWKLLKKIDEEKIDNDEDLKRYLYFLGSINLIEMSEYNQGILILERALNVKVLKVTNFLDVLIIDKLAVAHYLLTEIIEAEYLFNQAIKVLETLMIENDNDLSKAVLVIFNCAKFYSEIKNHNKSIELCDMGIAIAKRSERAIHLDKLYYEKAYNLYHINQKAGATKCYFYALAYVELSRNKELKKIIKDNIKEYNISFDEQVI